MARLRSQPGRPTRKEIKRARTVLLYLQTVSVIFQQRRHTTIGREKYLQFE